MRKPKAPLAAWIVEQRKAREWKSEELAARLGVSDSTVRSWESGRAVSADNLAQMERLFGLAAPDGDRYVGQDALVAAIDRQTAAIDRLVQAIEDSRADQQGMNEGLAALAAQVVRVIEASAGTRA